MATANDAGNRISDDIVWIGGDDRAGTVFEGNIPVPKGISYNSYLILDDTTCLLNACGASVSSGFRKNLRLALGDRDLDYFVIGHVEPECGMSILDVLDAYPNVTVVGNRATFEMLYNFYGISLENVMLVEDDDSLCLGTHILRFVFAAMVHWPEVMFAYDETDRVLFSAGAFGTFGTLSGSLFADQTDFDAEYLDEARRYYSSMMGRYGSRIQDVFEKLAGVPMDVICPTHGPVWRKDLGYILGKYDMWSRCEPEESGVVIAYASVYGNTAEVADRLAMILRSKGVKNIAVHDVLKTHPSYVVSDAFRFGNIVLAAPTYNGSLHPSMVAVLNCMEMMAVQNRKFSVIGNGSWDPQAQTIIEDRLFGMEGMEKVGGSLVIKSSMKPEQMPDLEKLATDIAASL